MGTGHRHQDGGVSLSMAYFRLPSQKLPLKLSALDPAMLICPRGGAWARGNPKKPPNLAAFQGPDEPGEGFCGVS